jgi:ABC-type antimicrobial peptide transport system permease subunit
VELVDPFRAALIELDPGVPMDEVGTLEARLAARFDVQRLPTLLLGSFALLALALAAVGVYSLFSSLTNSRRQEFGVRLALGSSPWSIAGLVVKQGGTWALVGLAGGALGIALVGRALRGLLFDVAPLDPLAIALSITLLVFVGALALLSPVRRAARTEAVEILR